MSVDKSISSGELLEASKLSEEVLKNIELSELPLSSIALRLSRLCRLLKMTDERKLFEFEVSGYPFQPAVLSQEEWKLAQLAGRVYLSKDLKGTKQVAYVESIDNLEEQISTANSALRVTSDPNVSISSTNPYQSVTSPMGNMTERANLRTVISTATKRLSERKTFMYKFALERYFELKFSNQVADFFTSTRRVVDTRLSKYLQESTEKLSSILENLKSENSEDWSNAVHSCRRLLQLVADSVFPSTKEVRFKGKKEICLGPDNYINRLVCFVEDASNSEVFERVVGSNLSFLGDRLDSIFNAAQKGSHKGISNRIEAERYVVYTYMILGDILDLADSIDLKVP